MRRTMALGIAAALLLALAGAALAQTPQDQPGKKPEQPTAGAKPPAVFDTPQSVGTRATCPVTGEVFTINKHTEHSEVGGKYVYFCCPACKPKFDADPQKYLGN